MLVLIGNSKCWIRHGSCVIFNHKYEQCLLVFNSEKLWLWESNSCTKEDNSCYPRGSHPGWMPVVTKCLPCGENGESVDTDE